MCYLFCIGDCSKGSVWGHVLFMRVIISFSPPPLIAPLFWKYCHKRLHSFCLTNISNCETCCFSVETIREFKICDHLWQLWQCQAFVNVTCSSVVFFHILTFPLPNFLSVDLFCSLRLATLNRFYPNGKDLRRQGNIHTFAGKNNFSWEIRILSFMICDYLQ